MVNSGGYIHGDAKRRGIYLALFTDPGGGGGGGAVVVSVFTKSFG